MDIKTYRNISLFFVVLLFFVLSASSSLAEGVGIKEKPTQVDDMQIVNKVDRDGDGKISDFDIRLKVGSDTFKFPSPTAQAVMKGSANAVGALAGVPLGWITKLSYTAKLAPQFCVTAGSVDSDKPIPLRDYWMPGNKNSTVIKNISVSKNNFVDTRSGSDSLSRQIKSGKINEINAIQITTHYKAIEESGIKPPTGKVTVENPPEHIKKALEHPCGISDLKKTFILTPDQKLQVEPSSKDKEGRVRFLSDDKDVEISVEGDSLGTTPLVHNFPSDIGKVQLTAKKDGYKTKTKTVELNPTDDAKQAVEVDLKKIKKPIVIKSTPSDADITINNGVVPYKTPHTLDTWIKRSPTITISTEENSKTFQNVSPPATINADLKTKKIDYSNINDKLINPNLSENLIRGTQIPDIDYSNIVPPSLVLNPIEAKISTNITSTKTGKEIEFDASESYSLLGSIDDYSWDFGDGKTTRGEQVSHKFGSSGKYKVRLTIIDKNGKSASAHIDVNIKNRKPNARFVASDYQTMTGEDITFDANASSDFEGKIKNYKWKFGNGKDSTASKVNHSYAKPGDYKVSLQVKDNEGSSDKLSRTISVQNKNKPPKAKIRVSQKKIGLGQNIQLDASKSSDDGAIRNYNWLINGEKYLNGKKVEHKFSSTGTKKVQLSVVDYNGEQEETTSSIEVVENKVEIQKLEDSNSSKNKEPSIWDKIVGWFNSLVEDLF